MNSRPPLLSMQRFLLLRPEICIHAMKFFIFLFGIGIGAAGYHYYHKPVCPLQTPTAALPNQTGLNAAQAPADNRSLSQKARDGANAASDAFNQKIIEWHLTPAEINAELEKTGRVVRQKTAEAGVSISNAKVVAVIKGKYALEDLLATRNISVSADSGKVTLRGVAPTPEVIAHAVAIALDTDGVTSVDSQLTLTP